MSLTETANPSPSASKSQPFSLHALPPPYRAITNRFHKLDGRSKAYRAIKRRMARSIPDGRAHRTLQRRDVDAARKRMPAPATGADGHARVRAYAHRP